MGVIGNYRSGPELRKKRRQQFHYRASILVGPDLTPRSCAIADVSESGARILLDAEDDLPERFVLMLTRSGSTRRLCDVAWRKGLTVGVKFVNDD